MSRDLLDLVRELNTLNDDNLADRVIENSDVQWCLSELQDILEEAPTLTPQNEWVSVEERLPEHLKDVLALYGNGRIDIDWVDGSGDFKFGSLFDGVTHWMPLPAPPEGPSDWDFSEPPRWTEQDREDAKMIKRVVNGFQIGVARDNLARLRTIAKDGFPSEYINSDMFPSLNPGESAMLDEIIGGAE